MIDAILSDIRSGLGQDEAAARNGIHRATLSDWIKSNLAFCDAVIKAKAQFEHDNLQVIREASVNRYDNEGRLTRRGSWQASAWLLERRMHEKYGMRWAGELTGKGGVPLLPEPAAPAVDLSQFKTSELKTILDAVSVIETTITPPETNGHTNGNGS